MSRIVKWAATGWIGFLFTAIVYMGIQAASEFVTWLMEMGPEGFSKAALYHWLLFGAKTTLSMGVTLRALMNESYGAAKDQPPGAAK